jgi:hypothetical protein
MEVESLFSGLEQISSFSSGIEMVVEIQTFNKIAF